MPFLGLLRASVKIAAGCTYEADCPLIRLYLEGELFLIVLIDLEIEHWKSTRSSALKRAVHPEPH